MDEEVIVQQMLARAMYLRWCAFKQVKPKSGMYADAGSLDYAAVAIDMLGYDDEAIDRLKEAIS